MKYEYVDKMVLNISKSPFLHLLCEFVLLLFIVMDFIYIYYSNKKKYLYKKQYVIVSVTTLFISILVLYSSILIGLFLFNNYDIVFSSPRFSDNELIIFLFAAASFPIIKLAYDFLGLTIEDKTNFMDIHVLNCNLKKRINYFQINNCDGNIKTFIKEIVLIIDKMQKSLLENLSFEVKIKERNEIDILLDCLNKLLIFFETYSREEITNFDEIRLFLDLIKSDNSPNTVNDAITCYLKLEKTNKII